VKTFSRRGASYGDFVRRVQLWAATLAAFAWLATPVQARTMHVVALGDSLTAGYGLPPGQGFAEALARALKAKGWDIEVTNAGVSGETAEDGLARYDWSVPAGTDALLVELGANDMLRGLPPEGAEAALSEILDRAKKVHLATLLLGMRAASNFGPDYQKKFDAIYPDLAARYGVALYPFFLDGVAGDPKLNQPDGLHPTRAGVEKIVASVLPSVEALLHKIKP
jgi:acyl-CoA thioesterase I